MDYGLKLLLRKRRWNLDQDEFNEGYINAYPIAKDGYNKFFDVSLEGVNQLLSTEITSIDFDDRSVAIKNNEKITSDLIISTISPDFLFNYCYGELEYVGRDFFKIVLPIKQVLPDDVYFIYYPDQQVQQTRVTEFKNLQNMKVILLLLWKFHL